MAGDPVRVHERKEETARGDIRRRVSSRAQERGVEQEGAHELGAVRGASEEEAAAVPSTMKRRMAHRAGENRRTNIVSRAMAQVDSPCLPSSACMMPAVMAAVRKTTLVINETKGHERVAVSVSTS
eukprot:4569705-Pleurochrysis_carterae.AAC.2